MSIQSVWVHLPIYDKDGINIGSARTRLVEFEDHQAEIAGLTKRLEVESVTRILIDVELVDGDGLEIFAKSAEQVAELINKLSDQLEAAELNAARYEWISVKEKLPLTGYVIAYRPSAPKGNQVSTINYDRHQERFCGQYPVTHWVPLPMSPKDAARLAQGESK